MAQYLKQEISWSKEFVDYKFYHLSIECHKND